jgi:hypothetical protein
LNSLDILPVLSRSYPITTGRYLPLTELPEWPQVSHPLKWPCAIEKPLWEGLVAGKPNAQERELVLHELVFSLVMTTGKYREYPLVVEIPVGFATGDAGEEVKVRADIGYDGDGTLLCLLSAATSVKKTKATPSHP